MHSGAVRCVCVYMFITDQCWSAFQLLSTKNKYPAQTRPKQEEEEEDEGEAGVRCLSGRNAN